MSNTSDIKLKPVRSTFYQIGIEGHLGAEWADWFEGLSVTRGEGGETLLTGPVADQAALYGLLKKIRDLGMPLLSLNRMKDAQADAPDAKP